MKRRVTLPRSSTIGCSANTGSAETVGQPIARQPGLLLAASLGLLLALASVGEAQLRVRPTLYPQTAAAADLSADAWLRRGLEFETAGQWQAAADLYRQALEQWPQAVQLRSRSQIVDRILEGEQHEALGHWPEALRVYEEALEAFPSEGRFQQRLDAARIRHGLSRRYHDSSYLQTIRNLTEQEALALCEEVLLKVDTHYVHEPNWQELLDQGTQAMLLGLEDETFKTEHLQGAAPQWLTNYRQELRRRLGVMMVRDRQGLLEAIREAGRVGRRTLGLAPAATIMEYTHQAVSKLDEYSTYLTSNQLNDLYSQIDGNFVGLGVELQDGDGALLIVNTISGSPAERGGLQPQDRIVAVDGRTLQGLTTDEAAALLQGPQDSEVTITVVSPGREPRALRLIRKQVEVPSIEDVRILNSELGLGYLKLTSFQKTTPRELDEALWSLHRQGMRGLVMDLRGNPGGLLTTAVEVADRFVESGRIVSTRGRSSDQNWTYSAHQQGTWQLPLVVLIDGDSASAAEIFAGAIRDHRRGWIIGQTSYGKGSVQSIFALSRAGSGLRLTTAKFYSPNGQPYNKVGVAPHITVQQAAKPVAATGQMVAPADDAAVTEAVRVAREHFPPPLRQSLPQAASRR